jgi:hypothetical protein
MPRVQGRTGAACGRTPRGFLRCAFLLRLKPGACRPWQARSPGRAFSGRSPFPGSPLAPAFASGGPPKGLSSLPLSLLCSKDRCAPSVVRPLAGAGIHWIPPYGPALRLHSGLGLTKGVQEKTFHGSRFTELWLGLSKGAKRQSEERVYTASARELIDMYFTCERTWTWG